MPRFVGMGFLSGAEKPKWLPGARVRHAWLPVIGELVAIEIGLPVTWSRRGSAPQEGYFAKAAVDWYGYGVTIEPIGNVKLV